MSEDKSGGGITYKILSMFVVCAGVRLIRHNPAFCSLSMPPIGLWVNGLNTAPRDMQPTPLGGGKAVVETTYLVLFVGRSSPNRV